MERYTRQATKKLPKEVSRHIYKYIEGKESVQQDIYDKNKCKSIFYIDNKSDRILLTRKCLRDLIKWILNPVDIIIKYDTSMIKNKDTYLKWIKEADKKPTEKNYKRIKDVFGQSDFRFIETSLTKMDKNGIIKTTVIPFTSIVGIKNFKEYKCMCVINNLLYNKQKDNYQLFKDQFNILNKSTILNADDKSTIKDIMEKWKKETEFNFESINKIIEITSIYTAQIYRYDQDIIEERNEEYSDPYINMTVDDILSKINKYEEFKIEIDIHPELTTSLCKIEIKGPIPISKFINETDKLYMRLYSYFDYFTDKDIVENVVCTKLIDDSYLKYLSRINKLIFTFLLSKSNRDHYNNYKKFMS